ncbi:MAG: DNA-binding protein [Chloroflexi bacterium]|nr:DNA-binding protein [Chloroflexota bacterium]
MAKTDPSNAEIADLFQQIADLLEQQEEDNPFRIRAYRQGAQQIREMERPLVEMVRRGDHQALETLPDIGSGLAALIVEFVETGRSGLLDDLRGNSSPVDLLAKVPGLGPELAGRIVEKLDIETLPELEQAAHDGRLEAVEGFGPRRIEAVKVGLSGLLTRSARQRSQRIARSEPPREAEAETPSVALLLELDVEYRQKAEANELRKIAPRRFNPDNKAWLPIMHEERHGWLFTVLYSNTARAHELNMTQDWVVIYYKRSNQERQNTVVTATRGPLAGKRVVRGREKACISHYNLA